MQIGVEQEDSLIIRKILLTHDPDGRCVDSWMLLQMIENVMCYATTTSSTVSQTLAETLLQSSNKVDGTREDLWKIIHNLSCEILCKCSGQEDLHARTMSLFELLRNFTWDAKVVVALSAFATSYGEFCLLIQLYPVNPLAVSVAMLKKLPNNLEMFKHRFKTLSSLVTAMVDVTKCIIEFETLPTQQIKLDHKEISATKSQIYAATYWVLRSTLTCSSLITDLIAINDQQVHVLSLPSLPTRCINKKLDSDTTNATWELSSLVYKVTRICRKLRKQVDKCHLQIEDKLHTKLLDLFQQETHLDNQEVLSTLFSLKDEKPLKDCFSQEKIGVPDLLNKVVVLLISKPEILPLEELLFLVQQTCSNFPCDDKTMRQYEIVWVPIPSSSTWTDEENKNFNHLSDIIPWYSIRQPSRVSSVVVNYLEQVSGFVREPVMVVIDQNGRLANLNAMRMVYIWGPMAYPFSASREEELWEEVNWFGQLLTDEIDPLLSKQVEEGRICLYGSSDINWIRDFSARIKEVTDTGLQLDLIYVGKRRLTDDQHVSNIISTIDQEKLSSYLFYPKMHFFWLRMESIKRSKLKLRTKATIAEHIFESVGSLMNLDDCGKSWALFGEGFSKDILQIQGRKLIECLRLFQEWGENIEKVGFMEAIRCALEPPMSSLEPCYSRCNAVQFVHGNHKDEGIVLCEECKRPTEMFTVYQCDAVE